MSDKQKRHNGPYIKEVDYKTLEKLCAIHCTGEECAAILEMDYDTLNKRLNEDGHDGFSEYFKKKSSSGKMSLRRKQIEVALSGNTTMLIWMGKQHLDQKDQRRDEIVTPEGVTFNMGFTGAKKDD